MGFALVGAIAVNGQAFSFVPLFYLAYASVVRPTGRFSMKAGGE
jgi:hypothetical protein